MKRLFVLGLLAASVARAGEQRQAAPAGAPAAQTPPTSGAVAQPPAKQSLFFEGRRFGVQLDAGAPGGLALAAVVRPWRPLRVDAGMGWNYLGFGVKGGLTVVPFDWKVAPIFGVEGGHFFDADASELASGTTAKLLLKDFGYSYVTGDVGVEFGSHDRFVFFIRAGLSYLWGPVKNVAEAIRAGNTSGDLTVKSAGEATASYFGPSAKLGFVLFVY